MWDEDAPLVDRLREGDDLRSRIEAADEIDRLKKAGQELADEFRKCRRIMQNRQPDKLSDGVYIADHALDAWNTAVKGECDD